MLKQFFGDFISNIHYTNVSFPYAISDLYISILSYNLLESNITEHSPVKGLNWPTAHVSVLMVLSLKHTMYMFG